MLFSCKGFACPSYYLCIEGFDGAYFTMDALVGKKTSSNKGLQCIIIKPAVCNSEPRKVILCA